MLSCKLSHSFFKTSYKLLFRNLTSWQLSFDTFGEPKDVLYSHEVDTKPLSSKEVMVNFRASPINPSDINTIQGVYPLKPQLPGIPGHEGAGYIIDCGKDVKHLKPGDLVIPNVTCLGTWRNLANLNENQLIKINPKLKIDQAAIMNTNLPTAYLMLTTFQQLKPGDCIIQNGSTSAVGIYIMQMCKIFGVNSINLFRQRSNSNETESTRQALLKYGASLAVTEEELKKYTNLKEFGKIKLGFNCLGGKPTIPLIRNLENSGILVTYGGMTRQPIPVSISSLIFKDIQFRGFWVSSIIQKPDFLPQRKKIIDTISDWMINGKIISSPFKEVNHTEWKTGISEATFNDEIPSSLPVKQLLVFPEIK